MLKGAVPILLCLVLAGCASAPATPQEPQVGRIDGAVIDSRLQPYGNLSVLLVDLNRTDLTSAGGGFTFLGVPPGTYTLSAQAPGTAGDVEKVVVTAGKVTRIILQMQNDEPPAPIVTSLQTRSHADLVLPDTNCDTCTWSTYVLDSPQNLVAWAQWESLRPTSDELTMSVSGPDGAQIGSVTGPSPLGLELRRLPAGAGKYTLSFAFEPGFTPQPFDLESYVEFHHSPGTPS